MSAISINLTEEYRVLLTELKNEICTARLKAALAINQETSDILAHWRANYRMLGQQTCRGFIERSPKRLP
jgi:hypothetical protein